MNQLSPHVRKVLVAGVLLTLVFSIWSMVFRPLFGASGIAIERLHDTRFELGRARTVVSERDKVSESAISTEEQDMRRHLQTGDSPANAIGYLQGNVDRMARESGLQLESMSVEPHLTKEPVTKVFVVLKAKGSELALMKMLAAVESHQALMVVDRLTVVAQGTGQAGSGKTSIGIAVEMRIGGYWARPEAAAGPKS